MLNIAICDDEISMTGKLDMMLNKIAKDNFIETEIDVFWDGESLIEEVRLGIKFDIIYMDIELGVKDGITAAKQIREYDKNVLIIYVTSHENYMKESFSVRPFRFLVKPIAENEINECFQRAYEEISESDFYFRFRFQRINHKLPIREILYFESAKRKIHIVTKDEVFTMYAKLNEVEESLKTCKVSFLRVHQSFLVNYKHVEGQSYDFVLMDNNKKISISEDKRRFISEQYCMMEDGFVC